MKDSVLKILFWGLSLFILASMIVVSRDAGISGDEDLHLTQSKLVYNYFATCGKDQSALNTPKTHLQYYGQSVDNIATILSYWLKIDDIYTFRHVFSTISGWLTIMFTAFFAVYLTGYGAGIFTLFFFAISPFFLGHSMNNLKDIPFALAYIISIFFTVKFFAKDKKISWTTIAGLTIGISLAISIRAGGLLMICYLFVYYLGVNLVYYINNKKIDPGFIKQFLCITGISLLSYFMGLLLWPYALANPILHPLESYRVMTSFPTTLRQIFEGQSYWSDFLPWYYLPKYMAITIPVVVMIGIVAFLLFSKKLFDSDKKLVLIFVLFTIFFPMTFVILKKSNLYGSWRHFLFIYPCIVLISAIGLAKLTRLMKSKIRMGLIILIILAFSIHPLKFMIQNHPYHYLYYNQLVGGLNGAYGNYETDYYYHSIREGSEWLNTYLKNKNDTGIVKVGANFSAAWFFKNNPQVKTSYFPYTERSRNDWDYAIIANSYIHPDQLKNGMWPPQNTIHTIKVDGVPICSIIKRRSKAGYEGISRLESGDLANSLPLLKEGVFTDPENEYLWYKYAWALYKNNQKDEAENALKSGLTVLPHDELILQFLGDIAAEKGDSAKAANYYEKAIAANIKFFRPYVKLANLYTNKDEVKARSILFQCLHINSKYKPAILALADTYRTSNPEKAKKYDQMANSIK